LKRLDYRTSSWDAWMAEYIKVLEAKRGKPVVVIGDLNVCHGARDVHNFYTRPDFAALCADTAVADQYSGNSALRKQAGLTVEERESFGLLLSGAGLVDTFRHFHPNATGVFSYFSQRVVANKPANKGLRLDYVLTSKSMVDDRGMKGPGNACHCT